MKNYLLIIAVIFNFSTVFSQTVFDANINASSDINGTARYMSMGGAFGALGGDASSIIDNPAGLGVFRKSEISTTLNMQLQNSSASWNDVNSSNNKFNTKFNNFSYIIATPTFNSQQGNTNGLLSSNWSVSFNQIKNFDRDVTIKGGRSLSSMTDYMGSFTSGTDPHDLSTNSNYNSPYDNPNVSWLSVLAWDTYLTDTINGKYVNLLNNGETVSPNYQLSERGHINKYTIAWSGNFSNKFYLGASVDYTEINHSTTSTYDETFGAGGNMSLMSNFSTKGGGASLTLGAIYKPTYNLRLGFAFHSPTFYYLTDHSYSDLVSNLAAKNYSATPNDAYYDNSYILQGPLQINASIAYVLQKGLLSAEYVYNNTTGMKLMDSNGSSSSYDTSNNPVNSDINNMLNNVHTIKLGGEYRLTDNLSLRAGYAFKTASLKTNAVKYLNLNSVRTDTEFFIDNPNTNYYSVGFGYHENNWFLDFAYQRKNYSETFYPYDYTAVNNTNSAKVSTSTDNLVATLGFKF